jgi:hypothetical protein
MSDKGDHRTRRRAATRATALGDDIQTLVSAALRQDDRSLAAVLDSIAHPRAELDKRQGVSIRAAVAVYRRDCWTCRYCGICTIAPPVLRLLSELYPEEIPHHPN